MNLEWLGHSSFRLSNQAGVRIVTDPFDAAQVGIPYPKDVACDFVTVSHAHFDHDHVQNLPGHPRVIRTSGKQDLCGVAVEGIECFHDDQQGALRGKNVIFKFHMDGITLCHMGDLGESFREDLVQEIGAVDLLMIPVGGTFTIDAALACTYVRAIAPKIVIPMHYHVPGYTMPITPLSTFLGLWQGEVQMANAPVVSFTSADMQGETRVFIPKCVSAN